MDLGAPIGGGGLQHNTISKDGFDQGEHGAGIGLSGGHGAVNSRNTQAGMAAAEAGGFNSGVGGEHASGGLSGNYGQQESTPIANRFMGNSSTLDSYGSGTTGQTQSHSHSHGNYGDKLENSLDQYEGQRSTGPEHHHHHHQSSGPTGQAVSGAYSGGGVGNALTGESHAQRTGAGVGPLGENMQGGAQQYRGSDQTVSGGRGQTGSGDGPFREDAAAGSAGGAAILGAAAVGGAGTGTGHHQSGQYQSGQTGQYQSGTGQYQSGQTGQYDSSRGEQYSSNDNSGFGGAAGGLGSGGGASGRQDQEVSGNQQRSGDQSGGAGGNRTGHYGTVDNDDSRGKPVADLSEIDHGNPHSLVLDPATNKYVHRRDLEGQGSTRQ